MKKVEDFIKTSTDEEKKNKLIKVLNKEESSEKEEEITEKGLYFNYNEYETMINENLLAKAINITKNTVENLRRLIGFAAAKHLLKIKDDEKTLLAISDGLEKSGIEGAANTMDAKQLKELFDYVRSEIKAKKIKTYKEFITKLEEILGMKLV